MNTSLLLLAACFGSTALAEICCAPNQWEGKQFVVVRSRRQNGQYGFTEDEKKISYDATNKKVASSGKVISGGGVSEFKIIEDFNSMKAYFILPEQSKCEIFTPNGNLDQICIPDDAELNGNSFLGAGQNTLEVKSYIFKLNHQLAVAIVTKEGCVPVTLEAGGTYKNGIFLKRTIFANVTEGIKDDSIFSPPDYCNEVSIDLIAEKVHKEYSKMRVLF